MKGGKRNAVRDPLAILTAGEDRTNVLTEEHARARQKELGPALDDGNLVLARGPYYTQGW